MLDQYSKATRETADNLRIIDDSLFRLIAERKGVCQEMLRTLLDMPNLIVVNVIAQSAVKSLHREIVLDALCIMENGEYVNIEMQKEACNNDIMRARFHAAALTAAYTPKGTDFDNVPQVTILYITEYDALSNHQAVTHVQRCMKTKDGFIPVADKEDIFFANTEVKENSDRSDLLRLFLRKDAFEDARFPEISKAIKYFKQTEGGRLEVCKTVENYAKEYAKESEHKEKIKALENMLKYGVSKEKMLEDYSEEEVAEAEKAMLVNA